MIRKFADEHREGFTLDAGLQPERTRLAWRRTVLALFVGAIVALRVLPPALEEWGVALGAGGTVAALTLAVAAARRGASVASALRAAQPLPPVGALLAAVATMVSIGALAGLTAVITIASRGR
jgi:uncharacterized membrane protein YidH (DUF202 family)